MEAAVRAAASALESEGAVIEEVGLPWTRRIVDVWAEMWQVFMAAYFGHLVEEFGDRMDRHVVELIEAGNRMSARDYKRLEVERTQYWRQLSAILQRHDALLCPTTRVPAPAADEDESFYDGDPGDGLYHGLDMTSQFNLFAPCPALSVPAGWSDRGLPIGMQIVGRRFGEATVLTIGKALEGVRPWAHRRPPL